MQADPMHDPRFLPATSRRGFLRTALAGGAALLAPLALTGCADDPLDPTERATLDLRTDDGVLNALYAMTQLKGEFFHRVVQSPYPGMPRDVQAIFTDIRAHAVSHARYFTQQIPSRTRIYDILQFDFRSVSLDTRAEVMTRAAALCETTAAGWAGAVVAIGDPATAGVVAKMAAVHARHAAAVHDLADAEGTAFASGVGTNGLGGVLPPATAIRAVEGYFRTQLDVRS